MRCFWKPFLMVVIAGTAWSQALTDAAGIVAGGSVGVGAGKKVSEGITSVLQNVNTATGKAAKTAPAKAEAEERIEKPKAAGKPAEKVSDGGSGAVLQTTPGGVVKDHSLVPPPPPKKVAVVPPPPPPVVAAPAIAPPVLNLPPPRQVTQDDLRTLASGTPRSDLLRLGEPASRITMYDDGHLLEIFRYQARDTTLGVVRLSDGTVASVQIP